MSDNGVSTRSTIPVFGSDRLWFDPNMLNAATSIAPKDFSIAMGVTTKIAVYNARRWGIGFFQPSPAIQMAFAPWPDVTAFQFDVQAINLKIMFYTLFNYGPLVSNSWYVNSPQVGNLRVIELLREPGGQRV